jgi:aconitate hydratase
MPDEFIIDDSMIEKPLSEKEALESKVIRGGTIVVPEVPSPLPENIKGRVLLKCGDIITTDHIMPAGPFLKLRSNVPEYSKVVFNCFNEAEKPSFAERAIELKKNNMIGIIVAGESYGQGSSREHAALCPMYLGVRIVIAKSIERIHKANLVNFCIVPIEFAEPSDYEKIEAGDEFLINNLNEAIAKKETVKVQESNRKYEFIGKLNLIKRDREILTSAGLLNYTLQKANG